MNGKVSIKKWMYLILAIVGVIGIMIYLKFSGILGYMSSIDELKGYIEGLGSKAYIVFFIIQLISIIVAPIPSNFSAVAGAIVLGMWESFIITTLAIIIGSAIIFSLSRIYGRMFVERFVNKKLIEKYENLINSPKGESVIFLMLLLPFFPDDIINFIVGISNMSFKRYFVILMLTRPWEILLASALGSASLEMPLWGWGVIIIVSYFIIVKSSKIEEKLTKLINKENKQTINK